MLFQALLLVVCSLDVYLFWVALGADNECEDSVEYVLEDQEQCQSEDPTGKMIVTMISFLILLCLDESFPSLITAACHLNIKPSNIALKTSNPSPPSKTLNG